MARVVSNNTEKRGREESSEPWRQSGSWPLARAAPGTLLRSALTDLTAVVRFLHVVSGKPHGLRARAAWVSEAHRLVRRATDGVAAARRAAEQMRSAVMLEFLDAWGILSG